MRHLIAKLFLSGSLLMVCACLARRLAMLSCPLLKDGITITINGEGLSKLQSKPWLVLLSAYSQSSSVSPQVKDDHWQTVVTLLKALMELLPNELRFPAATKFLPALNEVRYTQRQCFLGLRIHLRNSFSTRLRLHSQR